MPDEDPAPHPPVTMTHTMPLPARDARGPYRIALLALHFGPLPPYLPYFLESCGRASTTNDPYGNGDDTVDVEIHCIVFHTDRLNATERPAGEGPRARLEHISAESVAKRLMSVLGEDHCPSTPEAVLKNLNFEGQLGSKINDLKPTYGAMCEQELRRMRATHWGWTARPLQL